MAGTICEAQQYTGIEGLLHVPSAEMSTPKSLRLGYDYHPETFVPPYCDHAGDVPTFYIALTPFKWVDVSYMMTAYKDKVENMYIADRTIMLKIRPLEEGKYWPAVALGTQDPFGTGVYTNYYIAATKHFNLLGGEWGIHGTYRKYDSNNTGRDERRKLTNDRWNGLVGGITFRPGFFKDLRATVEYTGNEVNAGLDVKLWKFLRLQGILMDGRYWGGGICVEITGL